MSGINEFFMGPRFAHGMDEIEVDTADLSFVVKALPIAGPFFITDLEDGEMVVTCANCKGQSFLRKRRPPLLKWARAHRCGSR